MPADPHCVFGWLQAQFIDFCILCGCDYAGTIRGIGPVRALQLIQVCIPLFCIMSKWHQLQLPISFMLISLPLHIP